MITATSSQIAVAREAARIVLSSEVRGRRAQRKAMKNEIAKVSSIATFILLFRLGMFILDWWMSAQKFSPSAVITSDEPWADVDEFEFESSEEPDERD
jgi:hypothetical protein